MRTTSVKGRREERTSEREGAQKLLQNSVTCLSFLPSALRTLIPSPRSLTHSALFPCFLPGGLLHVSLLPSSLLFSLRSLSFCRFHSVLLLWCSPRGWGQVRSAHLTESEGGREETKENKEKNQSLPLLPKKEGRRE